MLSGGLGMESRPLWQYHWTDQVGTRTWGSMPQRAYTLTPSMQGKEKGISRQRVYGCRYKQSEAVLREFSLYAPPLLPLYSRCSL